MCINVVDITLLFIQPRTILQLCIYIIIADHKWIYKIYYLFMFILPRYLLFLL